MEYKIEGGFKWKMIYKINLYNKSVRGKGDPPVESPGLDWTPLLSKLLREEPRCSWIQNWP